MKTTKIFALILALAAAFLLGGYTASTIGKTGPVETYRWVMTIICGLGFLVYSQSKDKE